MEGFKHEQVSKILLYRAEIGRPLEDMLDQFVVAVASDRPLSIAAKQLDLNQPESIADFIVEVVERRSVTALLNVFTLHSKSPELTFRAFGCLMRQCPTRMGDPTLPSALRRFTSEFGMGSGGTTALLPPGKFVLFQPLHSRVAIRTNLGTSLKILSKTPSVL